MYAHVRLSRVTVTGFIQVPTKYMKIYEKCTLSLIMYSYTVSVSIHICMYMYIYIHIYMQYKIICCCIVVNR